MNATNRIGPVGNWINNPAPKPFDPAALARKALNSSAIKPPSDIRKTTIVAQGTGAAAPIKPLADIRKTPIDPVRSWMKKGAPVRSQMVAQ